MRIPARVLNQDDFLKLVVAQLSHQDPLQPQADTAFIAQMASFTTLEQAKTMQSDIAKIRAQQQVLQGMSLMNREVVIQADKTNTVSGVVTGLDNMDGKEIKVVVGNKAYPLSDILEVRLENQNKPQN